MERIIRGDSKANKDILEYIMFDDDFLICLCLEVLKGKNFGNLRAIA
jgi:hypothetical protein